MARLERWNGSEAASREKWEGSDVARWKRWESSEVARWEVPGFIRGWGMLGESKILSFVSDVNQRNEVVGCVKDILAWRQGWKDSL